MSTRTALRLNAVFSLIIGGLLAAAPSAVGGWLGVSIDGWLRLLGVALLGHGALLLWVASLRDVRTWTTRNLAVIAPYPALMVVLVVTELIDRPLGQGLALLDGAIVAMCAFWQWAGLRATAEVVQPQQA